MTWNELKNQCIALGFTKQKEYTKNKAAFIDAANWAQNYLAANVKPVLGKKEICQRRLKNLVEPSGGAAFYDGEPLVYKACGAKAYYFECDGDGKAVIEDGNGITEVVLCSANGGFNAYRGFCLGAVTITFTGEYAYCVHNIAVYGSLLGSAVEDIPAWGEYAAYDFRKIDPAFMGFAADKPVYGDRYRYVSDYKREEDHVILLKREDCGRFLVWYKKYPAAITTDTEDSFVLELDETVCGILPYFMAYRLWLDDDMQKAVLYYNTANDLIAEWKNARAVEKAEQIVATVDISGCGVF